MNNEIMEDEKKSKLNMNPATPIPSKHKDRKERKHQKMIMLRKNEHKVKKYISMETL